MLPPPASLRRLVGAPDRSLASLLAGHVVNVNVPKEDLAEIRGLRLCAQGVHCHFPNFAVSGCLGGGQLVRRARP